MSRPAEPADRPEPPAVPNKRRLSANEQAAAVGAEFDAGRRNPFESVDLSGWSPEARAKAERLQRERGFYARGVAPRSPAPRPVALPPEFFTLVENELYAWKRDRPAPVCARGG